MSKTLAGEDVISSQEPRVAIRRGLPLIIPGVLRLQIEGRNQKVIKGVLTILSVYRVMKSRPKLKLETITLPHSGVVKTLPELTIISQWIKPFIGKIAEKTPYTVRRKLKLLTTAGPNSSLQLVGYPIDAIALRRAGLIPAFNSLANALNAKSLIQKLEAELQQNVTEPMEQWNRDELRTCVGKLSLKLEPAGKVRVFAIVDAWSQSLLSILHQDLFKVLRNFKSDGTFDQLRPVRRLLEDKSIKKLYSFDLSAATDRLPVDLQVDLLNLLYGDEIGNKWRALLVDRDFILDTNNPEFTSYNGVYRYSVGQPMGALSSWALLALSHHAIVQVAAYRVGWESWFSDYALLGDDIVIADESVAKAYLRIMKDLGVEINLSKSVISSSNSCEFAKKLFIEGIDLSPLGPKAVLQGVISPRNLRDVMLNYNLLDGVELADIQETFRILLKEGQKFSSQKWLRRFVPLYWDIVGMFGLKRGMELSPFFREQAIISLSPADQTILNESFKLKLNGLINRGWLQALENDVNIYRKYSRYLGLSNISHFPSTQDILEGLSSRMMETSYHFDIASGKELAYAFSSQSRLSWVIEADKSRVSSSIKSLELSKQLLSELWQNNPSLALAIVRDSQAVPWFVNQEGLSLDPIDLD